MTFYKNSTKERERERWWLSPILFFFFLTREFYNILLKIWSGNWVTGLWDSSQENESFSCCCLGAQSSFGRFFTDDVTNKKCVQSLCTSFSSLTSQTREPCSPVAPERGSCSNWIKPSSPPIGPWTFAYTVLFCLKVPFPLYMCHLARSLHPSMCGSAVPFPE